MLHDVNSHGLATAKMHLVTYWHDSKMRAFSSHSNVPVIFPLLVYTILPVM